ncbi:hypothetical protein, partial [Ensifer sp. Root954]|uniref:hypothetical protein n=1 Tax=Ensifer sp. Root954 TaxID=1736611 RepID=UPI001FCE1432
MEERDTARKQGTFNIYKFYSITFQLHRLPSIILDVRHGTKLGAECFLRRGQKRKSVSLPAAEASKICVVGAHEIGSLAPKDTGARTSRPTGGLKIGLDEGIAQPLAAVGLRGDRKVTERRNGNRWRFRQPSVLPGFGLSLGITLS